MIDAFLQRSAGGAPALQCTELKHAFTSGLWLNYGRGAGVGRRLGVGAHLPLHGP